jgi:hypothetical protein
VPSSRRAGLGPFTCVYTGALPILRNEPCGVFWGKADADLAGWNSKNSRLKVACLFPYTRQWPQALVKRVFRALLQSFCG